MTIISKIALFLSIGGALLMARGLPFEGDVLWLLSNSLWVIHTYSRKEWDLFILSLIYGLIALYGVWYLYPY